MTRNYDAGSLSGFVTRDEESRNTFSNDNFSLIIY